MLTQDEFSKILKFINDAQSRLDIIILSDIGQNHKSWIEQAGKDLGKLTDYIVDEVKIKGN